MHSNYEQWMENLQKGKTIKGYSYLCQKKKKGVGHGSPSSYNTAYCPWI